MNILEMDVSELQAAYADRDKLEAIFELLEESQKGYQKRYKENGIHTKPVQTEIRRLAYYLIEELMECTNLLKNREWMQTQLPTDLDHIHDEVADVLHFVILFFMKLGINAETLWEVFLKKLKVNEFRLRTGY